MGNGQQPGQGPADLGSERWGSAPADFGRPWSERWGESSPGRVRRFATEFVLPQQQIRRDCFEAQRVAAMFEQLENMDEALRVPGQRRAPPKTRDSSRICSTLRALVLCLPIAGPCWLVLLKIKVLAALVLLWPLSDFQNTLLVHALALALAYLVFGPLFRWLSLTAMRRARKRGSWCLAKAVYLNSILLREERAASSILCAWGVNFSWWSSAKSTREALLRPCIALMLLLLTGGFRKLLEFAFLNSKLRTRFQADVLTNAFERAAWMRLAELPEGSLADDDGVFARSRVTPDSEASESIMPDIDAPHVFERRTAEMLRTAFCNQADNALDSMRRRCRRVRRRHSIDPGIKRQTSSTEAPRISPETLSDLLSTSSTIFLTQAEGRSNEIQATARALFQQLTRDRGCRGRLDQQHGLLLRVGLEGTMPEEDAERTWRMLVSAANGNSVSESIGISEQDFVAAFRATFERFHVIAATVKDYAGIWFIFSDVLAVIHFTCSLAIVLAIFFPAEVIRTVFISISTAILGLSFIFGGLLREVFESVVHILVMNPYDVGDRIQVGQGRTSKIYTVQKINILTTEVRDLYNQTIYFKNSVLFKGKQIVNLGRSLNAVVEVGFDISASQVSNHLAHQLKEFVKGYIMRERDAWVPSYLRCFSPVDDGVASCDLSGAVTQRFRLMHRKPWQHIGTIRQDVTKLLLAVLEEMRRLDLDFRLPTMPVQVEGLGNLLQDGFTTSKSSSTGGGDVTITSKHSQVSHASRTSHEGHDEDDPVHPLSSRPGHLDWREARRPARQESCPSDTAARRLPRTDSFASDITDLTEPDTATQFIRFETLV